jgi:hypothetical protein
MYKYDKANCEIIEGSQSLSAGPIAAETHDRRTDLNRSESSILRYRTYALRITVLRRFECPRCYRIALEGTERVNYRACTKTSVIIQQYDIS